jgi:plastocyanin
MLKRSLIALVALLLAGFALSACSSSSDDRSTTDETAINDTTSSSTSSSSDSTGASSGGGSTIDISADPSGALAFEQTDVTADAGKDTLDFTNDSSTPHDVVIEDDGGTEVGKTDVISGDSATADVDLKPGTYTFFCSVPGHREAGMEGTLTVK